MRRSWLVLGVSLGISLLPGSVRAQTNPAPVRVQIEYEAPTECPDQSAFWEALRARTPRVEAADSSDTVVRVTAGREAGTDGHWGSLLLLENGVVTGRRRVDGASCDEVVEALGLAAALSLDPEAMLGPPPDAEPSPPPTITPPDPPPPTPPPASAPRWRVAFGSRGVLHVPAAPMVFGGAEAFTDLEGGGHRPTGGLALGYSVSRNDVATFGVGQVSLTGCPTRLPLGGSSAFLPCAVLDAGWISGAGRHLAVEQRATRSWLAAGLGVRFQLGLSKHVFVDLGGWLSVPMVHREFLVGTPGETVAESPVVNPSGKIGLGLRP